MHNGNPFNTLKIFLFAREINQNILHTGQENSPLKICISLEASAQHLHPTCAILRVFWTNWYLSLVHIYPSPINFALQFLVTASRTRPAYMKAIQSNRINESEQIGRQKLAPKSKVYCPSFLYPGITADKARKPYCLYSSEKVVNLWKGR